MSTFGDRVREERSKLGLNQIEFAALGGAKKHSQINYEADRSNPSVEYLAQLAANDVDVLYILTGERRSGLPSPTADQLPARLRERLTTAIEAVEEGLAAVGRTAAPSVKAELILAAYDILASQGESASAEIIRLVRTA